jgi:formylglycine-generating enzyme required for sulfatase activity
MNDEHATKHRVIRGGCCEGSGNSHCSMRRYPEWPQRRDRLLGFRVVRNAKETV